MFSPRLRPAGRLHADRAARRHRHHRRPDRPAPAGRAGGPRGGPAGPVRQQPQADRPGRLATTPTPQGSLPASAAPRSRAGRRAASSWRSCPTSSSGRLQHAQLRRELRRGPERDDPRHADQHASSCPSDAAAAARSRSTAPIAFELCPSRSRCGSPATPAAWARSTSIPARRTPGPAERPARPPRSPSGWPTSPTALSHTILARRARPLHGSGAERSRSGSGGRRATSATPCSRRSTRSTLRQDARTSPPTATPALDLRRVEHAPRRGQLRLRATARSDSSRRRSTPGRTTRQTGLPLGISYDGGPLHRRPEGAVRRLSAADDPQRRRGRQRLGVALTAARSTSPYWMNGEGLASQSRAVRSAPPVTSRLPSRAEVDRERTRRRGRSG